METTVASGKKTRSPSWKVKRDSFTGDELIEAYLKGVKEGIDNFQKVLLSKLDENITHAKQLGSLFIDNLNKNNLVCTSAHLKYLDIIQYKIIFVLNAKVYFDFDAMTKFYELAYSFEAENSNNDFSIEVSFIPEIESINNNQLISDGYIFKYNG